MNDTKSRIVKHSDSTSAHASGRVMCAVEKAPKSVPPREYDGSQHTVPQTKLHNPHRFGSCQDAMSAIKDISMVFSLQLAV